MKNSPKKKPAGRDAPARSSVLLPLVVLFLLGGGFVVCAGVAVGAYFYFGKAPDDGDNRHAELDNAKAITDPRQDVKTDDKKIEPKKQEIPASDGKKNETKTTSPPEKKTDPLPPRDTKPAPKKKQTKARVGDPQDVPAASEFPGLIGYWSFDDIAGNIVKDLAPGGGDGVLFGSPAIIDGVRGKAIRLDGSKSQYFDYAANPRLNFPRASPFTIAAWFKPERDSGTILSHRHTRPKERDIIDLTFNQFKLKLEVRDQTSPAKHVTIVQGDLSQNVWHHVAVTRQGSVIELFLDGISIKRTVNPAAAGPIESDLRALGQERFWMTDVPFGNPTFQGALDELCAFDRVLTNEEIRRLAGVK